jgi:hypothetical protein
MIRQFRQILPVVVPAIFIGCSDEAMIPEAVLNSPPATPSPVEPDYYPERNDPAERIAGDGKPLFELTVDRPYETWTLPQTAANSLANLGPAAVPVLVSQLRSPNVVARRQAAEILARVGPDAVRGNDLGMMSEVVARVEDPSEDLLVRKACARAVGQIGPALAAARAPAPPVLRHVLEPLPPLSPAQLADPIAVAAREREQSRRDYEQQRAQREEQRYAARLRDFELRQQLAERAASALMTIAEQGAGQELASAK